MTLLKKTLILATILFGCAISAGTDQRKEVILTLPETATAADLFTTLVEGKPTFSLPDTPQFSLCYSTFPRNHYPAEYTTEAGTITLGAFMRFIWQGHSLFKDRAAKTSYRKALCQAIGEHMLWNNKVFWNRKEYNPSQNWAAVLAAQEQVYTLLKQLPLNDPATKKTLERILSSPTGANPFTNLMRWTIFPGRFKIITDTATGKPAIKLPSFLSTLRAPAAYLAVAAVSGWTAFYVPTSPLGYLDDSEWTRIRVLLGINCILSVLEAGLIPLNNLVNNEIGLSPEPGNGIKVTINLEPASPA